MSTKSIYDFLKRNNVPSVFAVITATLSIVLGIMFLFKSDVSFQNVNSQRNNDIIKEIEYLSKNFDSFKSNSSNKERIYSSIKFRIDSLTEIILKPDTKISDDMKLLVQIKQINFEIEDIKKRLDINEKNYKNLFDLRLKKLEDIIIEDPTKAIALPLMRKDLDNMSEKNESEFINLKNDVSRVYDQNKWFIGLMFTMAISILGLTISNFINKNK